MSERDIAASIVELGLRRGVALENIVEEVTTITMPSFIDSRAFQSALLDTIEQKLRAQVDEQIERLRSRLGASAGSGSAMRQSPAATPPADVAVSVDGARAAAEERQPTQPVNQPAASATSPATESVPEEELPGDATMIWMTQHGNKPR